MHKIDRFPRILRLLRRNFNSKMASDVTTAEEVKLKLSREDVNEIIPKMTHEKHKGQAGRIGVIGGSKEYTGAPYFAAFTALRMGADLSHVFCTEAAGIPIKTYSPDLIVHPMLDSPDAIAQMKYWLPRLHVLVIGPGLGRDQHILDNVKEIINLIKEHNKPMVLDGDALFLITQEPNLIANYDQAVLTPNVIELERLHQAVLGKSVDTSARETGIVQLSKELGGITIVGKGEIDAISVSGERILKVKEKGSPRRCGGQGDILAGAIGTFVGWTYQNPSSAVPPTVFGAYLGCLLVKKLNKITFDKLMVENPGDIGRSMVTRDMLDNIGNAFYYLTK